jgi:hypothetical protein
MMLRRFWRAFCRLWSGVKTRLLPTQPHFRKIEIRASTPGNAAIRDRVFYVVRHAGRNYWVLFRCPCGCGEVVNLSLQRQHRPHWTLELKEGGATLYPSVWNADRCLAHYFVRRSGISWCKGTGVIRPMDLRRS